MITYLVNSFNVHPFLTVFAVMITLLALYGVSVFALGALALLAAATIPLCILVVTGLGLGFRYVVNKCGRYINSRHTTRDKSRK